MRKKNPCPGRTISASRNRAPMSSFFSVQICRPLWVFSIPFVGFSIPFVGFSLPRVGYFAASCRQFPPIFMVGLPSMGIVWIFPGSMWNSSWRRRNVQQLQMLGTKWPWRILPSRVVSDYPLRFGVDLSKAPFGEPPKNRITWSPFAMVKPIRLPCCLLGWCMIFKPFFIWPSPDAGVLAFFSMVP